MSDETETIRRQMVAEINADPGEPLSCVLVRSDNEAVVVNLPDITPVEPPEEVYWVDGLHQPPR